LAGAPAGGAGRAEGLGRPHRDAAQAQHTGGKAGAHTGRVARDGCIQRRRQVVVAYIEDRM